MPVKIKVVSSKVNGVRVAVEFLLSEMLEKGEE
jgi:hypothetical protein